MLRNSLYLLIPLFAACSSLFGLSEEDATKLAAFQSNASIYWERGNVNQALDQVRRGLEIQPDDYKLLTIQAWCWLRLARTDPAMLDRAATQFDRLLYMRADSDQNSQVRLGYAQAQSKLGLQQLKQADDMREEVATLTLSPDDTRARTEAAKRHEEVAKAHFARAEQQLKRLIDVGDQLLEAHHNLMTIKAWDGDYNGAVDEANAYLERNATLQDNVRSELDNTLVVEYEREKRIQLEALRDQELRVRAFLANVHYKQGHHELAVRELNAVLLKNPNLFSEYYNRGRSLMALGRSADARRDLERFLSVTTLPTESPQVQEALRLLRQ